MCRPSVYTEANRDAASNEFRQFIASKYGADFEPRCEFSGTELAATKLLSLLVSRYRSYGREDRLDLGGRCERGGAVNRATVGSR